MSKWINVKDRLPKIHHKGWREGDSDWVLICSEFKYKNKKYKRYDTGFYTSTFGWYINGGFKYGNQRADETDKYKITHWMKFPKKH